MLTQVACPGCGAARDDVDVDVDVSCPACGFANPPLDSAEELIAGWVVAPTSLEPPPTDRDMVCVACGYEGPMIASPDGDRVLCPACGDPWQDRGGLIRKSACPDCGRVLLLSEQHRGKTVICPKCHSLLGCLIHPRRQPWRGHSTILDIMALAAASALGYMWAVALWAQHAPRPVLNGISVVVLPITWTLVALRFLGQRPSRRRRFVPPGLAACLAVSAASAFNACCAWNADATIPAIPQDSFVVAALRVVEPQPIAAAVVAVWALLILDRRWRPERSWIDRLGRCLGISWIAAGLAASMF